MFRLQCPVLSVECSLFGYMRVCPSIVVGSATALDSTFIFQQYVLTNAVGVSALSMYTIFLEPKIEN